jgi:hypothetical protein
VAAAGQSGAVQQRCTAAAMENFCAPHAPTPAAEKAALLATVKGGSGWPASWSASGGEPCGDGWNSSDSGWLGLQCDAKGGHVTRVDAAAMGVDLSTIHGNVSGWSAMTQATNMCVSRARR